VISCRAKVGTCWNYAARSGRGFPYVCRFGFTVCLELITVARSRRRRTGMGSVRMRTGMMVMVIRL